MHTPLWDADSAVRHARKAEMCLWPKACDYYEYGLPPPKRVLKQWTTESVKDIKKVLQCLEVQVLDMLGCWLDTSVQFCDSGMPKHTNGPRRGCCWAEHTLLQCRKRLGMAFPLANFLYATTICCIVSQLRLCTRRICPGQSVTRELTRPRYPTVHNWND